MKATRPQPDAIAGTDPAANPLARDEVYVRNMAVLFRADARLAQAIDECEPDGSVRVEVSRRGAATAAVRPDGGDRPIYLHSKVDPEAEATRFAEAVELGESLCFIVGGFGLGHHLRALRGRLKGDAFLIVTEPNLHLLKAALDTVDLADLFAGDRCIVLTRADKGEVQTRLEPVNTLMMMGAQFVSHAASDRAAGTFHAAMRKLLADHMSYCRMSLVTLVANSRVTCKNIANNLPTYLTTPPIDGLRDRFAGCPAVVVSGGPSLRRNIDQLATLKGRAVIIAVQTTFKMLMDRGIEPDFVTSLDFHEMSKRHFEGVSAFGRCRLIAEPKVTWHVVDAYGGGVSLLDNEFARLILGDALGARGGLKAGATVSHLAFYLAVYMGCDPIVLVGQDLGYSDHVYYTPGVAFHELWRPELNRFCTIETKEWERLMRARKILLKAKDIHGHDIYTDQQLFMYLQQFEGDFAAVPGRVIDATEGGVRKAGTRVMTLADAAEAYCTQPIDSERFAFADDGRWGDVRRLHTGRDQVRKCVGEIDDMIDTCYQFLKVLEELKGLLDRPDEFNRRIAEVDRLRARVRQQERAYRIISQVAQHAELQRFTADRKLGLADVDSIDRARRQLDRDIRFVTAIREGADVLKEILKGGAARIDAAIERKEGGPGL